MLVVLDACVLYPPSLRDLLLTLAALDAYDVVWSELILEELARNVVGDNPGVKPEHFKAHTLGEMKKHFPEAMVTVTDAEIAALDNDPKDRHVAAIGVVAGADAIVTFNRKDFSASAVLRGASVDVISPGALVQSVFDDAPEIVTYAVTIMSSRLTKPPLAVEALIDLLSRHPTMAGVMGHVRNGLA